MIIAIILPKLANKFFQCMVLALLVLLYALA